METIVLQPVATDRLGAETTQLLNRQSGRPQAINQSAEEVRFTLNAVTEASDRTPS